MEFLKEILGEELFNQFKEKVDAYNGDESNKDKQIKLANLTSGEYVGKGKFDALQEAMNGKDAEITNANNLIAELKKASKGNEELQLNEGQFFDPRICNTVGIHGSYDGDYISDIASRMATLSGKMEMVRRCCKDADDQICDYIFKAVTEDLSYVYLSTVLEIPCGRDMFYDRYRKFYAILDKIAE